MEYEVNCEQCGEEFESEKEGEWIRTFPGNQYEPPEYDWFCHYCLAVETERERAF